MVGLYNIFVESFAGGRAGDGAGDDIILSRANGVG